MISYKYPSPTILNPHCFPILTYTLSISHSQKLLPSQFSLQIMFSYTPKYPMPYGFKIQGYTPTQEEYDQMMDLLAFHVASPAAIQTPITSTPSVQKVVSTSQEATSLEIVPHTFITSEPSSTPKTDKVTSLEAPIDQITTKNLKSYPRHQDLKKRKLLRLKRNSSLSTLRPLMQWYKGCQGTWLGSLLKRAKMKMKRQRRKSRY